MCVYVSLCEYVYVCLSVWMYMYVCAYVLHMSGYESTEIDR